ncbi:hypothetical protein SGPA1_31016 [Streptomyces misionensis JCM 4497]
MQPERGGAHGGEQRVRQRARRRDQTQPRAAADAGPLDEHRAARQPDPAHDHEQHRQYDAQQRVRVLQRVQRQIALGADGDVAAVQGGARVRVLVQAQREDPGGRHEQEHRDARPRRVAGPGGPAGHRRHGQDPDEHRTDPPVAGSDGGGGHGRLLLLRRADGSGKIPADTGKTSRPRRPVPGQWTNATEEGVLRGLAAGVLRHAVRGGRRGDLDTGRLRRDGPPVRRRGMGGEPRRDRRADRGAGPGDRAGAPGVHLPSRRRRAPGTRAGARPARRGPRTGTGARLRDPGTRRPLPGVLPGARPRHGGRPKPRPSYRWRPRHPRPRRGDRPRPVTAP